VAVELDLDGRRDADGAVVAMLSTPRTMSVGATVLNDPSTGTTVPSSPVAVPAQV